MAWKAIHKTVAARAAWGMMIGAVLAIGCERKDAPRSAAGPPPSAQSMIEFPAEVQADDPEVNAFVREAIGTCIGGDYERFRLLWSVHEDPFPRGEFERGWKAVRRVRIRAVQKMRNPPEGSPYAGKYLYYVHGQVELDDSVPDPEREVLLLLIEEGEQWRLARAPKNLRTRVLGEPNEADSSTASPTTRETRSPTGRG